jgi:hypothetical protein
MKRFVNSVGDRLVSLAVPKADAHAQSTSVCFMGCVDYGQGLYCYCGTSSCWIAGTRDCY